MSVSFIVQAYYLFSMELVIYKQVFSHDTHYILYDLIAPTYNSNTYFNARATHTDTHTLVFKEINQ